LLKADLHIHTRYSMDCDTPLDKIVRRCQELRINCVAIADHGTAEGALEFVLALLDEAERILCVKAAVRMDAGFPEDKLLCGLETRRTPYVARVRNNPVLNRMAEPFLRRPPGRRPDWRRRHPGPNATAFPGNSAPAARRGGP